MKSKILRIGLGVLGLAGLGLGVVRTIPQVVKSLHASASSNTVSVSLDVSFVWPAVAAAGVALCVWSYLLLRASPRS